MVTSPGGGDDRILLSDRFTPGGTAYDGIVRGYDDGVLTPDSVISQSDTVFFFADSAGVFVNDTLGSVAPDSFNVGTGTVRVRGKYMFVTNLELQFPIVERQIYGLFFFDAGNSWLRKEDMFDKLYKGAGIGFRVVVPGIGTIGFDFAYAFDPVVLGSSLTERGWRTHFQIGTTFR